MHLAAACTARQADSDLDLVVLTAGYAEPLLLWRLSGELAELLLCEVDLLDLRAASTVMQYQIITTGRLLWSEKPAGGLFECFVLSEKTALDAAILNIQRACEAALDMEQHLIRRERLGVP